MIHCDGLGTLMEIDEDLVIPNKELSIMDGAIASLGRMEDLKKIHGLMLYLKH